MPNWMGSSARAKEGENNSRMRYWSIGNFAAATDRAMAIGELQKIFASRGPATLPDFAWWGGMNLSDAKKALKYAKMNWS